MEAPRLLSGLGLPANASGETAGNRAHGSVVSRYATAFIFIGIIAFGAVASPAHAQVSDEEWALTLGAGASLRTNGAPYAAGPSLFFRAQYGVHPLWNLAIESSLATHFDAGDDTYITGGAFAGASTMLDVVAIVPWVGVYLGGIFEPGAPDTDVVANPAAMISAGIENRKRRTRSWGVQLDVIGALQPELDFARYMRLSFRFSWIIDRDAI